MIILWITIVLALFATVFTWVGLKTRIGNLYNKRWKEPWGPLSAISCGLFCLWLLIQIFVIPITYYEQISDKAEIVKYEQYVDIAERKAERLQLQLNTFRQPDLPLVTVNKDVPYKSIIEELASLEDEISLYEKFIENRKTSIEKRKRWIYSFVVEWAEP